MVQGGELAILASIFMYPVVDVRTSQFDKIKEMKTKIEHQKGVLALVLLSMVFASMGLFARYLSTGFVLLQQVYLRVFAAFFLGLIVFKNDLDFKKLKKISKKRMGTITF